LTSPTDDLDVDATYPVAEKRPDLVTTTKGTPLGEMNVENLMAGKVDQADIRITAEGLRLQAAVARGAGRACLAENFERGAELVAVPDDVMLATYELLRPGRARNGDELRGAAARMRADYGAERIACFLEEAAAVYEKRGLFRRRF
jgi:propanediol dehydratase small subunit